MLGLFVQGGGGYVSWRYGNLGFNNSVVNVAAVAEIIVHCSRDSMHGARRIWNIQDSPAVSICHLDSI